MGSESSKLSRRLEDYLEAVLVLVRQDGVARVRDIAAATSVSKSSVTAALKQLSSDGLVNHDPYQYVTLTPRGRVLAQQVLDKHELLTAFLANVLNIDPAVAEENACRMEHVMDDAVLKRLGMLAAFIQECPLGEEEWLERFSDYCLKHEPPTAKTVPPKTSVGRETSEPSTLKTTMDQMKPGQKGSIVKIGGVGPTRRRLMDMGMTLGTPFEVERVAPLGDPIEIRVRSYHLTLRKQEAHNIVVEQTEE